MSRSFSIAYFLHTIRSDWNNGNAHFLRGLVRSLLRHNQHVIVFEQAGNWSESHLLEEAGGRQSLAEFSQIYTEIPVANYTLEREQLRAALASFDVVIIHEWNPPELVEAVLALRGELGFRALFHDTHHRASSSPDALRRMAVDQFDGVLAFGDALREIYSVVFGLRRVWTFHEAADTSVFFPRGGQADAQLGEQEMNQEVVWVGNWGDDERSREIYQYLLGPASRLPTRRFRIFGVRYPEDALAALGQAGVAYGGYVPNLRASEIYARSRLTVHIPRQQYTGAMAGIPTIRVFEALASGIPLISAPWRDTEGLFREGDLSMVHSEDEMVHTIERLLGNPEQAAEQARKGLERVLALHTCDHRAAELAEICNEVCS